MKCEANIKKCVSVLISFMGSMGMLYSQTTTQYNNIETNERLRNYEVYLSRPVINPVNLTDSGQVFLGAKVKWQWVGLKYPERDIALDVETGILPYDISLGLFYRNRKALPIKHHLFIGSVKKGFDIGSHSSIEAGINLGIEQYKYDYSEEAPAWFKKETAHSNSRFVPVLDLGAAYRYKKHCLGIAYKSLIKKEYNYPANGNKTSVNELNFVINYNTRIDISQHILFEPEVIAVLLNEDAYAILKGSVAIYNWFNAGALYNTLDESIGLYFGTTLFKRVCLGYLFDIDLEQTSSRSTYGSNCMRLSVILF